MAPFLSGPRNPEQEALPRVIGSSIVDPLGADVEDAPPAVNTGKEWSDADLKLSPFGLRFIEQSPAVNFHRPPKMGVSGT